MYLKVAQAIPIPKISVMHVTPLIFEHFIVLCAVAFYELSHQSTQSVASFLETIAILGH